MNEPPGARARVALSGLSIAEYFRDGAGTDQGKDVILVDLPFYTSFRQILSYAICSGVSTNISYRNGSDAKCITSTKGLRADDLTDPAPATTFAHL
jgi:F-type H+-transporting ATPase subunit beta